MNFNYALKHHKVALASMLALIVSVGYVAVFAFPDHHGRNSRGAASASEAAAMDSNASLAAQIDSVKYSP